jgi:hypothetical protein
MTPSPPILTHAKAPKISYIIDALDKSAKAPKTKRMSPMKCPQKITIMILAAALTSPLALATPQRIDVINASHSPIFLHVGGYAPASRLEPGRKKTFHYPFEVVPPGKHRKAIKSALLVATAGGRWVTTTNGYTYLSKPQMLVCLNSQKLANRRIWRIKHAYGFDKGCQMKGFKQPWYKPRPRTNVFIKNKITEPR